MYSDNPDFDEKFQNAFGPIAFTANRHLIEHMIRVQRELDIDYDTLLIWGVLAHLNVAHMLPPGRAKPLLEIDNEHRDPDTGMRPLRLRDLADCGCSDSVGPLSNLALNKLPQFSLTHRCNQCKESAPNRPSVIC